MVSITDTGPIVKMVDIGGKEVKVFGISFEDLVPMLDRFPELRRALTPNQRGEVSTDDFSFEGIVKMGPRIVGAAIAAGVGDAGDENIENWAKKLSIGYQIKLMKAIIELTFPKGLADAVEDLKAMGLLGAAEEEVKPNGSAATGKVLAGSSSSKSASSANTPVTPAA